MHLSATTLNPVDSLESRTHRVLHLEDSDLDAEFVLERLKKDGILADIVRVDDRRQFIAALDREKFDLILSDYQIPSFDGLEALTLAQEYQPETPFIFVSGAMGEELAIDALKLGATDYVLKQRLARLSTAFTRAIAERDERARRIATETSLRERDEWLRFLAQLAEATQPLSEPGSIMAVTARLLAEHLRVDRCAYAEVEHESIFHITGDHSLGVHSIVGRWPVAAFGNACVEAMKGNVPFVVEDSLSDPRIGPEEIPAYEATAIRAVICVPLHKEGRFTAAMAVHQVSPRQWTPAEIRLVSNVVSRCWETLERARAAQAERKINLESQRRRRLYETALSNTPDLVYVWDLNHRFTYANEALLAMWGISWDEAIGKNCLEIGYEPWHAAMHDREIEQVKLTKQPLRGEVPFSGTNGRRIYDYILVPVIGSDGEVEAVAGTTRDVTDRQAMEQDLRDTDRKKDDFIALLAHELRNPLAPIRSGLQVLRLTDDPAVHAEFHEMMDRQLTHMVRLVDDLLDVSRIGRDKLQLQKSQITFDAVIANAVETARPLIDDAGHSFTISLPETTVYLDADLTRLAQVFSNLLTNSAKYTPPGGQIEVRAKASEVAIEIDVIDNGIGIPAESLATVFDMFSQVDRSVERQTGGLGIGLALVKAIVEMHDGEVRAYSDGAGSRFSVRLPIIPTQETPTSHSTPSYTTERPLKILVVDDNADGAQAMAAMLQILGHHVRTASDGLEAIREAHEFAPNLILMDIGMPRLNGIEATRRIRTELCSRQIKIVALTGWGQEEDRKRSQDAGCNAHLVKPVSVSALQALIAELATAAD